MFITTSDLRQLTCTRPRMLTQREHVNKAGVKTKNPNEQILPLDYLHILCVCVCCVYRGARV